MSRSPSFLASDKDLPLSAQVQAFITSYLNTEDLEKAALNAGFEPQIGKQLYRRKAIREEIDRRMAAVKGHVEKLIAQRKVVTVDALDRNLMRVVSLPTKAIKEAPALAASKVRAIELGYQRTGILIDGNFIPDAGSDANKPDEAPRIFRATEQSIITHQVTETHQTVTTRAVAGATPPVRHAEPPTIDADPDAPEDPWARF